MLRSALDRAPVGPIRSMSLCSGDARDVTSSCRSPTPRRRHRRLNRARSGTRQLTVRCGDATDPGMFIDLVTADVLLLVGTFGHTDDSDHQRLISVAPAICRQDAAVIWTRHRREPDLTPSIEGWFADTGCGHRHSAPRDPAASRSEESGIGTPLRRHSFPIDCSPSATTSDNSRLESPPPPCDQFERSQNAQCRTTADLEGTMGADRRVGSAHTRR